MNKDIFFQFYQLRQKIKNFFPQKAINGWGGILAVAKK